LVRGSGRCGEGGDAVRAGGGATRTGEVVVPAGEASAPDPAVGDVVPRRSEVEGVGAVVAHGPAAGAAAVAVVEVSVVAGLAALDDTVSARGHRRADRERSGGVVRAAGEEDGLVLGELQLERTGDARPAAAELAGGRLAGALPCPEHGEEGAAG